MWITKFLSSPQRYTNAPILERGRSCAQYASTLPRTYVEPRPIYRYSHFTNSIPARQSSNMTKHKKSFSHPIVPFSEVETDIYQLTSRLSIFVRCAVGASAERVCHSILALRYVCPL